MVIGPELDRYLQSCLAWHVPIFDELLVYDDCADPRAKQLVESMSATYVARPPEVPTFMTHEGRFRQASLRALEDTLNPSTGDWIMGVDSDEFLVHDAYSTYDTLTNLVAVAEKKRAKSVIIDRPELWTLDPPAERMDGYWGGIRCTRLFRWEPGGQIADKAMGCGNEPTYINRAPVYPDGMGLRLFHVGYVEEEDRLDKYNRYSSLLNHGHDDKHIKSILRQPVLKEWSGYIPPIWRGLVTEQ
jgi:hypothetical protein